MRVLGPIAVVLLLAPGLAAAGDPEPMGRVGFVGLTSVDLPAEQIDPVVDALDDAIFRQVPDARSSKDTLTALRNDALIAQWCAKAHQAQAEGATALQAVNLPLAQRKLGQASGLYSQCQGEWTYPRDVATLYELRAQVAYGGRNPRRVYAELLRALPVHPTKKLDPVVFPPEVIQIFDRARHDAANTPMQPPAPSQYIDIARRTRVRWIVVGELRRGPQEVRLLLTLVEQNGDLSSTRVRLPVVGEIKPALDEGLRKLLGEAGVLDAGRVAFGPTPRPTPQPVPTQALPETKTATEMVTVNPPPARPWYGRWPVWAGVGGVLAAGTIAAVIATSGGNEGPPGGTVTPPPGGIEIIVDRP